MKRRSVFIAVFLVLVSSTAFGVTGPFTTRVAFATNRDGNSEIYSMSPSGSLLTRLTNNSATDIHPAYSVDGKRIAFTSARDGNNEIYVMNADGTGQTRMTNSSASDITPTISPTRPEIIFASNLLGSFDILAIDATGIALLTNSPGSDTEPSFSPKGDKIVFVSDRDGNNEIYVMNANGSQETRLTNNTLLDARPRFSRDGEKIVFARHVLGFNGFNLQVVVMNADGTEPTVLTSAGANSNPEFSAEDDRIFFNSNRDGNNEIYVMNADGTNETRVTNNAASDLSPSVQGPFEVETIALYRPETGQWTLATDYELPPLALSVNFGGQPGDRPVSGDWNADGRTDIGVFRGGTFHLALLKKNAVGITIAEPLPPLVFGQAGDLPVGGDWDGDGTDDVGVFRPLPGNPTGKFLLRQPIQIAVPFPRTIILTITFNYGKSGDLPVAGDWDGDGDDTIGVYRSGDPGNYLISNTNSSIVDFDFTFGSSGDLPLAGDWLAQGRDGVGVFVANSQVMLLAPDLAGKAGLAFNFGFPGAVPLGGSWAE